MKRVFVGSLLLVGLVALAGCCDKVPANAVTECQKTAAVPGAAKTDILFVVDDSGSMEEEQNNLRDSFNAFITKLASSPIANDYQIGITTTSVETFTEGEVVFVKNPPFCDDGGPNLGKPYPAGALVALDTTTVGLYVDSPKILARDSATLVEDFQRNVKVGICGSGKEQGLRAMKLALTDRIADGQNAGFLRPGARLAVVILSDEDDYTETKSPLTVVDNIDSHQDATKATKLDSVSGFVDFLHGPIAGEVRDIVVAVIAGVNPETKAPEACSGVAGTQAFDKADRYAAFANAFQSNGLIDSICVDFSATLENIAGLIITPILPLDQAPADWRMLSVGVVKSLSGERVSCTVGLDGSEGTFDVMYTPPIGEAKAKLTFSETGACALAGGDKIDMKTICAG